MIKLSESQLEALVKLGVSDEPVGKNEFSDLKPVSELVGMNFATETNGFYELNKQGTKLYKKVLKRATDYFESTTNSN